MFLFVISVNRDNTAMDEFADVFLKARTSEILMELLKNNEILINV
ncbi:MAG: hypothetical protein ACFFHD_04215 [Promethearchaeota archaeon]